MYQVLKNMYNGTSVLSSWPIYVQTGTRLVWLLYFYTLQDLISYIVILFLPTFNFIFQVEL